MKNIIGTYGRCLLVDMRFLNTLIMLFLEVFHRKIPIHISTEFFKCCALSLWLQCYADFDG